MLCPRISSVSVPLCVSRLCVMIPSCRAQSGKSCARNVPQIRRPLHDVDSAVPRCRSKTPSPIVVCTVLPIPASKISGGGPRLGAPEG
jgi:hypothetical protein